MGFNASFSDVKAACSDAEWQMRVNLAACYRLMDLYGFSDLMANHVSARVPGDDHHFLINPYGMLYEEITASSLIKIDLDGNEILKPDFGELNYGVNRAGFVIHSAIHRAKPELECVIHSHTWSGMAISSLECGIQPLTQTAMRFAHVAYHDFEGVVLDLDEQKSIVEDLGDHQVMILRNHGLLTVGESIAEAFNCMHRLELCCKAQLAAMACGSPLHPVPKEVVEDTYRSYLPNVRRRFGLLDWPALLRKLDRLDPSYAS